MDAINNLHSSNYGCQLWMVLTTAIYMHPTLKDQSHPIMDGINNCYIHPIVDGQSHPIMGDCHPKVDDQFHPFLDVY